jgi:hypothetical protein
MLPNQLHTIDHVNPPNPTPSNADLSYSTTNETVSPSNNLFNQESTTTSNISELQNQTGTNIPHHPLYNNQPIQGNTVPSNLQQIPSQSSYIPQVYNPYVPQYSQPFPQSQTSYNTIPFHLQHPYHHQHQHLPYNQTTDPHPLPTTRMTDPFTTAQLQAIDD